VPARPTASPKARNDPGKDPIKPGSTVGIIGGGQLGRMLAMAAAQLGYKSHIYSPEPTGPATEVAAAWTQGSYDDREAVRRFGAQVDVVTYEFENVDPEAVGSLAGLVPLRPSCLSLDISRHRPNEKRFVEELGGRCARYRVVETDEDLRQAVEEVGTPSILKTCMLGYDGKGQAQLGPPPMPMRPGDRSTGPWRSSNGGSTSSPNSRSCFAGHRGRNRGLARSRKRSRSRHSPELVRSCTAGTGRPDRERRRACPIGCRPA
jgi:hypothetical protein